MISSNSFEKNWINKLQNKYKNVNPPVSEKMIHSLCLVEELAKTDLEFALKGGTALVLLISPTRRFSIDVDIVTKNNKNFIEQNLKQICKGKHFNNFVLDKKRSYNKGVPKAHYKLFYHSKITNRTNKILLDILFSKYNYPELLQKQIKNEWINTIEPKITVIVPSVESILGDKMTAFAPNTTGILYGKNQELEIAKQLFDIGILFDIAKNVKTIKASFDKIVCKEIKYRNLNIQKTAVLKDMIDTALLIAKRGNKISKKDRKLYRELINGFRELNEFLILEKFRLPDAITTSSKIAYLAAKLLKNDISLLKRFSEKLQLENYMFNDTDYNFLNKLRKLPGGSLYFWSKTIKLLRE